MELIWERLVGIWMLGGNRRSLPPVPNLILCVWGLKFDSLWTTLFLNYWRKDIFQHSSPLLKFSVYFILISASDSSFLLLIMLFLFLMYKNYYHSRVTLSIAENLSFVVFRQIEPNIHTQGNTYSMLCICTKNINVYSLNMPWNKRNHLHNSSKKNVFLPFGIPVLYDLLNNTEG